MSDIRLSTPENYFEKSLERTLANTTRIKNRRKVLACACVATVLLLGAAFSIQTISSARSEKEYLAFQAEMDRLDIFLEINQ